MLEIRKTNVTSQLTTASATVYHQMLFHSDQTVNSISRRLIWIRRKRKGQLHTFGRWSILALSFSSRWFDFGLMRVCLPPKPAPPLRWRGWRWWLFWWLQKRGFIFIALYFSPDFSLIIIVSPSTSRSYHNRLPENPFTNTASLQNNHAVFPNRAILLGWVVESLWEAASPMQSWYWWVSRGRLCLCVARDNRIKKKKVNK